MQHGQGEYIMVVLHSNGLFVHSANMNIMAMKRNFENNEGQTVLS